MTFPGDCDVELRFRARHEAVAPGIDSTSLPDVRMPAQEFGEPSNARVLVKLPRLERSVGCLLMPRQKLRIFEISDHRRRQLATHFQVRFSGQDPSCSSIFDNRATSGMVGYDRCQTGGRGLDQDARNPLAISCRQADDVAFPQQGGISSTWPRKRISLNCSSSSGRIASGS